MTFGERLSALREKKGLTQIELAKLTKISRSRLSLYETNKREPDLETVKQLADFFGVSTDYLLGRTDESNPSFATDFVSIAIEEAEKMPKTDKEKAALERLKAMPLDEQQRRILEEFNKLSPEQQQAIYIILRSLSPSRQ